jgi:hypothetical protein
VKKKGPGPGFSSRAAFRRNGTDAQVMTQTREVALARRLRQNIGYVLGSRGATNSNFPLRDEFADVVILDADMFHRGVPDMVLCKDDRGMIIAESGRAT